MSASELLSQTLSPGPFPRPCRPQSPETDLRTDQATRQAAETQLENASRENYVRMPRSALCMRVAMLIIASGMRRPRIS
jgi:hypothetical protein